MKKLTLALAVIATALTASVLTVPERALAVSGADWKPGRIIDDVVFQNKNAMNVEQIQQFLDSKVPVCDRNGTITLYDSDYGDTVTRAVYSARRGVSTPFTCLKEYVENPTTKENNAGRPTASIPGGLSAAQLIYNASQAQNINPQVFLVLLQKEQSLITDDWAWPKQFERATGNNCPDTAPCAPQYAWFWTQVNNAGAQFNYYVTHFDEYNYAPGWNNILYQANNPGCGTRSVFIENAFTAALYIYTPYTPNQAALDNLYGTGDGCSAYGNRNFWRMFNDWFGSSLAPDYSWTWVTQNMYTSLAMSESVNPYTTVLSPKNNYYVSIKVRNTGTGTWLNSDTRIAITNPAMSPLSDSSWPVNTRPAILKEQSVAPGGIGTFEFWIKTPGTEGTYLQYLGVVKEGVAWMQNNQGVHLRVAVPNATYSWQWNGQSLYSDQTKTLAVNPYTNVLSPDTRYYSSISVRNTSNVTWNKGSIRLANVSPADTKGKLYDSSWLSIARIATTSEDTVAPGGIGTFEFWIKTPAFGGLKKEYYGLVEENVAWLENNQGAHIYADTPVASHSWQWTNQVLYTDSAKTTTVNPYSTPLPANTRYYSVVSIKNTGNIVWEQGPIRLANVSPADTKGKLYDSSWLSIARIATLQETTVTPGETGTFEFWITTPPTSGVYREYYGVLKEDVTWFVNSQGAHIYTAIP